MKKLLGIVVLGLLLNSNAFAEKISITCSETMEPWLAPEWNEDTKVNFIYVRVG